MKRYRAKATIYKLEAEDLDGLKAFEGRDIAELNPCVLVIKDSRSYHADTACQRMTNSKYVHTLYQALHVDKKNRCGLCHPITEEEARSAMTATKP